MTINYGAWDPLDEIPLWAAACLWRNTEPTYELRDNPLPGMEEMMKAIELGTMKHIRPRTFTKPDGTVEIDGADCVLWHVDGTIVIEECKRYPKYIPRYALEQMAKDKGEKPNFLFPEMRPTQNPGEKTLSTKERNSYLKLIKGLLKKLSIDPKERGIAKSLQAMCGLSEDKIRDILRELQVLGE